MALSWLVYGLRLIRDYSAVAGVCFYMLGYSTIVTCVTLCVTFITVEYLPSYFSGAHRRGDSYSERVATWPGWHFCWTRVMRMPPAEVVLHDATMDPTVQRIFGSHPHGVGSLHHMGVMMCPPVCAPGKSFERVSPGKSRRELAATILFRIPGLRELALALGCCDAGRAVVDNVLAKGLSIGLMVGGEQEQLLSQRGEHTVYVTKRKGIMKMALRHGVPLVPCYAFGETDLYHQSRIGLPFRQWMASTLGIAITLAYGRFLLLPFLPIPTKVVQVIGTPISVDKVAEPSAQDIERLHAKYMAGLKAVFDEHKGRLGYADAELVLV